MKHQLCSDYQDKYFGAWYDNPCCVKGYLWDLDSLGIDDNGDVFLDGGGDMPCPQCNTKKYVHYIADELSQDGYDSLEHPLTTKMVKNVMSNLPSNLRRMMMRYWRSGRREAITDAKEQG